MSGCHRYSKKETMKILFENVNLSSSSGPNHFASKLVKYLGYDGNKCVSSLSPDVDVKLTFIESFQNNFQKFGFMQELLQSMVKKCQNQLEM